MGKFRLPCGLVWVRLSRWLERPKCEATVCEQSCRRTSWFRKKWLKDSDWLISAMPIRAAVEKQGYGHPELEHSSRSPPVLVFRFSGNVLHETMRSGIDLTLVRVTLLFRVGFEWWRIGFQIREIFGKHPNTQKDSRVLLKDSSGSSVYVFCP